MRSIADQPIKNHVEIHFEQLGVCPAEIVRNHDDTIEVFMVQVGEMAATRAEFIGMFGPEAEIAVVRAEGQHMAKHILPWLEMQIRCEENADFLGHHGMERLDRMKRNFAKISKMVKAAEVAA